MNKGLFIVLYGPDGVGKSRQALMLEEKLREQGLLARKQRYPVYDCTPTGPKLDEILHRTKKSLPEEEMQKMFAQNRKDFEPTLKSWLENGVNVIGENYKGTGIAWGVARGMTVGKMEEMNKDTIEPDVAIYMDGPKRGESLVGGHPYGTDENESLFTDGGSVWLGAGGGRRAGTGRRQPDLGRCPTGGNESGVN
ncbi:hypothetical protein HYS82_01810 [Candidatus Amesbacteria bacterium]|nr:hypothetical protein [Candidatus Amesbacteria bacterium]